MIYPTPVSTGVANTCCGHQVCYSALHTNLILELCIKHFFQDLLKFFRISQFLDLQPKKTNIYRYTQTEDCYYILQKRNQRINTSTWSSALAFSLLVFIRCFSTCSQTDRAGKIYKHFLMHFADKVWCKNTLKCFGQQLQPKQDQQRD